MLNQKPLGRDRIGPLVPLLLTTLIASASVLTFWGMAHTYTFLVLLVVVFGASSGAFVVLRSSFATRIMDDGRENEFKSAEARMEESVVSGLLMSVRGVATIASGFVGKAIVEASQSTPLDARSYAGGRWSGLVVFTGVMMAVASLGAVALVPTARREVEEEKHRDSLSE